LCRGGGRLRYSWGGAISFDVLETGRGNVIIKELAIIGREKEEFPAMDRGRKKG
jgi:hypothetical protein